MSSPDETVSHDFRNTGEREGSKAFPVSMRLAQIVSCASVFFFLVHCVWVIFGPERRVMDWLYDDCFYYLIIAYHFSKAHLSSFDGVTLTTGYHPLWMWICSLIYGLRDRLDITYVRLCMALSATISGTVLVTTLSRNLRSANNGWLWALALGASSYSALNNGLAVMEWPLVILFWAFLHLLITRSVVYSGRYLIFLFGLALSIGLLGTLSRTDFGLIPVSYLAAAIVVRIRFQVTRPAFLSLAALFGSATGVLLSLIYNHVMTGEWLQKSAEVKHLFASVASPFNPVPAIWQFSRVLFYLPPLNITDESKKILILAGIPIAIVAFSITAWSVIRFKKKLLDYTFSSPTTLLSILSAVIAITCYTLFYSLNSQATYGWYTAVVTGFILVLSADIFSLIDARISTVIVIPLVALNFTGLYVGGANGVGEYTSVVIGKQMRREHPETIMGGGDVGKPSFYNDGRLINTDGLVNNEVFPYLEKGRIHCYILARKIEYLIDVGTISMPLTDAVRRRNHEPPVPWSTYFHPVPVELEHGKMSEYEHTDFDAIKASGECSD